MNLFLRAFLMRRSVVVRTASCAFIARMTCWLTWASREIASLIFFILTLAPAVLQPLGTCGAANRSLSARKRFVHSQFKNPKLQYLRPFRKRENEGFSGQNGLLLGQKLVKNGVFHY